MFILHSLNISNKQQDWHVNKCNLPERSAVSNVSGVAAQVDSDIIFYTVREEKLRFEKGVNCYSNWRHMITISNQVLWAYLISCC